MRNFFVVLTLASTLLAACGDSDSSPSGGSGGSTGSTSNGVTPCGAFPDGPKTCAAGLYCSDDKISKCENGCTADTNCASNQTCVKAGSDNVGACQNKATGSAGSAGSTGGTKDCGAYVIKCMSCMGGADCTAALCEALSTACVACVNSADGCAALSNCQALCKGQ